MKTRIWRWLWLCWLASLTWGMIAPGHLCAQNATPTFKVAQIENEITILRGTPPRPIRTSTENPVFEGDRILTGATNRCVLVISGERPLRIGPNSSIRILTAAERKTNFAFKFYRAVVYYFHRDQPGDLELQSEWVSAAVKGTEFNVETDENGTMTVTVFEGEVEMRAAGQALSLQASKSSGPVRATAGQGKPPERTAVLSARNVIQWSLYYPGVLHLDDLKLSAEEQAALRESLAAYRRGNLLQALAAYPAERQPASDNERIYHAAVLLSVGQVDECLRLLDSLAAVSNSRDTLTPRLAEALRQLIAAVKMETFATTTRPSASSDWSATEWLTESYYRQAQAWSNKEALQRALEAATKAVEQGPNFAFALARKAELEFSFPNNAKALAAIEASLRFAPENAEALALKGFLLSAENKITEAIRYFDQAIAVDGALGNAWLGRGLCKIRRGHLQEGREDLAIAAILEPQRAFLRSYLGKAYSDAGEREQAERALARAKILDPNDPTAWLYSALHNQQYNRLNEAARELEEAQAKNDNRRLYRSTFALDQDRAVKSVNLAAIYRDLGMTDVSVREAARAVNADYANYSAHLFLANSYDQLRDPKQINLRYETPWFAEYLMANLLAPVGAGTLSWTVSQQEYSKLFERDRLGLRSSTEYFSNGGWMESGSQYGTFGSTSYSFDAFYRSDNGQRVNNDLEQRTLSLQIKQQVTPQDTIFLQGLTYYATGGDLLQRYDQSNANPAVRSQETQEPIFVAGYHHEWNSESHTLILASRLNDQFSLTDLIHPAFLIGRVDGEVGGVIPLSLNNNRETLSLPAVTGQPPIAKLVPFAISDYYQSTLQIYTTEIQQLWRQSNRATILGSRFQTGNFHTSNLQQDPPVEVLDVFFAADVLNKPRPPHLIVASQSVRSSFQRLGFYGYQYWTVLDSLQLIGGVSYDHLRFPDNFRFAPLNESSETQGQVSPKGGIIWTPARHTTIRAAYSQSLSGASIDQSFQLEPTQVAGFNQAFRSIIPESLAAANAGAHFETCGFSIEQKFNTGAYLGVSGEILNSDLSRTIGSFESINGATARPAGIRENLGYREKSLLCTFNQLLGDEWAIGARYRISQATLSDQFPEIPDDAYFPDGGGFRPRQQSSGTLQQASLHAIYNDPRGFFAQFQALWNQQSNRGYVPNLPGDDFWQLNTFVGYRFPRRRAELMLGVLNMTDTNYRLNPINLYNELPRERTLAARFQLNF